ncbi:MAG TPA: hypothetical protein VL974_09280 [Magnetospirillum sp.]|nr:hypothetical protein [Magnetospirillum sp.]
MRALVLAAVLLPVAALAQQPPLDLPIDAAQIAPGELGNPSLGGRMDTNDPPAFIPTPPPRADYFNDQEAEALRRRLVGIPVAAAGSGRIGEISSVGFGPDGRVGGITVTLDGPGHPHLPVSWTVVQPQLNNPTIIVPWDMSTLRWLSAQREGSATR